MPQFTLHLVGSQLFWLILCFLVLYFFMSRICLPRIADILKSRKEQIDDNKLFASSLEEKIDKINKNSNNLRNNSSAQYQLSLEQANKQAIINREKSLNNLKKKIDKITAESENKIVNFVKDSKADCDEIARKLIDIINKKIL